jgi:hypothetical protein
MHLGSYGCVVFECVAHRAHLYWLRIMSPIRNDAGGREWIGSTNDYANYKDSTLPATLPYYVNTPYYGPIKHRDRRMYVCLPGYYVVGARRDT